MNTKLRPGFAFKMPGESTLLIGIVGLVLLAFVAIPAYQTGEEPEGPVADAREAYSSLQARIESSSETIEQLSSGSDSLLVGRMPLDRDLFAPEQRKVSVPARAEAPRVVAPPPQPKLTGILLDGATRRAVLNGQRVSRGDWIGDYRVIRIESEWVMLRKGEEFVRLELGGK